MKAGINKVIIKQDEEKKETKFGIIIADSIREKRKQGVVVSVGRPENKAFEGLDVGDHVVFNPYSGVEMGDGNTVIQHNDILMVTKPNGNIYGCGLSIIVEVEAKYNDTVCIKGAENKKLELYFDPEYRRTYNVKYTGKVKYLPLSQPFDEQGNYIDPILKIGDEVAFRFIKVDDDANWIDKSKSDTSKKFLVRMFYHDIFAKINDGTVVATSGWCLGKPIVDAEGEEFELKGKSITAKVQYHKGTTLIKKVNQNLSTNKCRVTHISTFKGDKSAMSVGDIVFSRHGLNFENEVLGEKYYCFKEDSVDSVLK